MEYPVTLSKDDNGTIVVDFPDFTSLTFDETGNAESPTADCGARTH